MTIRLIAVDLDGTLHNSAGEPDPQGCQALIEATRRGLRVVIATARTTFHVAGLARSLGLSDPLICANGAQVLAGPDGPLWADHAIPLPTAQAIVALAEQHGWNLIITAGETTYLPARPGQPAGQIAPHRMAVRSPAEALAAGHLPVRILAHQRAAIDGLLDFCDTHGAGCLRPEVYLNPDGSIESLGLFPHLADKGTALRLVLARLAIEPGQVLAIGDNFSDLPMFALAGLAVAMGNAVPEIQLKAGAVAPGNDQAGVAWAVRKFCFNEAL